MILKKDAKNFKSLNEIRLVTSNVRVDINVTSNKSKYSLKIFVQALSEILCLQTRNLSHNDVLIVGTMDDKHQNHKRA